MDGGEVGPGLGTLTRALLEAGANLYAVERDPTLHQYLKEKLQPEYPNFSLLYGDAVEHPLAKLDPEAGPFKIVANLPYAITSPWMDAVLAQTLPTTLSLMLQEEAADRLCAEPGTKSIGALTIDVALAFDKVGIHKVPAQCFYPPPAVGSVLLVLKKKTDPRRLSTTTRKLIRFCFTQRRKQLGALFRRCPIDQVQNKASEILEKAQIDPSARPESLDARMWLRVDDFLRQKY